MKYHHKSILRILLFLDNIIIIGTVVQRKTTLVFSLKKLSTSFTCIHFTRSYNYTNKPMWAVHTVYGSALDATLLEERTETYRQPSL